MVLVGVVVMVGVVVIVATKCEADYQLQHTKIFAYHWLHAIAKAEAELKFHKCKKTRRIEPDQNAIDAGKIFEKDYASGNSSNRRSDLLRKAPIDWGGMPIDERTVRNMPEQPVKWIGWPSSSQSQ